MHNLSNILENWMPRWAFIQLHPLIPLDESLASIHDWIHTRKNINAFNKSKNPLQNAANLSIMNELSTKQIELHGNNNENDSRPTQDLSSVSTFLPVTSLKPTLIDNDSSYNSTFDIESRDNEAGLDFWPFFEEVTPSGFLFGCPDSCFR